MTSQSDLTRYILEDRLCHCGCHKRFKVLSTSKQIFASRECEFYFAKFGSMKKEESLTAEDQAEVAKINRLFKDKD